MKSNLPEIAVRILLCLIAAVIGGAVGSHIHQKFEIAMLENEAAYAVKEVRNLHGKDLELQSMIYTLQDEFDTLKEELRNDPLLHPKP